MFEPSFQAKISAATAKIFLKNVSVELKRLANFADFAHISQTQVCGKGVRAMSILGFNSGNLDAVNAPASAVASRTQTMPQLGQDLQSGDIAAAQQDYVSISGSAAPQLTSETTASQASSTAPASSSATLAQALSQLGQDLGSGDLQGARDSYAQLERALQTQSSSAAESAHPVSDNSETSSVATSMGPVLLAFRVPPISVNAVQVLLSSLQNKTAEAYQAYSGGGKAV